MNLRIMAMRSTLLVMAVAVAVIITPANVIARGPSAPHSQLQCNKDSDAYCEHNDRTCTVELPDYSCTPGFKKCCASVNSTNCSGSCRAKGGCLDNEFTVSDCGRHSDCCETCQVEDCTGECVSNLDLCSGGNYINGTCTGGNCTCCVPCGDPDVQCAEAGGVCVGADNECPCGYFPNPDFGCTSGDCKCCVACITSSGCSGGHNPGRCVANTTMCDGNSEYISSDECISNDGSCSCCKTCTPDQICAREGGKCFKTSENCPTKHRMSILGGGCCSDECICCIEDPCAIADTNCTSDAYGTECTARTTCRNRFLHFTTNDSCESTEICCKACIPDITCSSEGGHCVNKDIGCKRDLTISLFGSCCDSQNCVCCIPDQTKTCWPGECYVDSNPVVLHGNCLLIADYFIKPDCGRACCKMCTPDSQCCSEGGRCYSDGCPPDLQKSENGSCNDDANCQCCV